MSLNRQRSRTRINRANTIPSLASAPLTTNDRAYNDAIEDSIQEWLIKSIAESSGSPVGSLEESPCRCCGQPDCENLATLTATIRKLEGETRLAGAEIGQSLLHKHETYVLESTEIKSVLEQQVEEARERIRELEQLLEDTEITKQSLIEQKNKSTWEWQKTQRTLEETATDLETANNRCIQLANELKLKTMEVEKLRIFKFMVRQADGREETLRAKLEDTKQELAVSRKNGLSCESKHKKLKARYETLYRAYEKLKLVQQDGMTTESELDLEWLRESNEKLRKDVLKLTSVLMSPTSDMHHANQNHLITVIKELASANNKLKSDLMDCRELLSETRNEVLALNNRIEEIEQGECDDIHTTPPSPLSIPIAKPSVDTKLRLGHLATEENMGWLSTSAPQADDLDLCRPSVRRQTKPILSRKSSHGKERAMTAPTFLSTENPTPASSSLPTTTPAVIHHHYHYHMQQQKNKDPIKEPIDIDVSVPESSRPKAEKKVQMDDLPPAVLTLSPSSSLQTVTSRTAEDDQGIPYHQLWIYMTQYLERLRDTDIRALNRRLRRAFDILELSTMSNSIIDNILIEVESWKTRFEWIEKEMNSTRKTHAWAHEASMDDFFPIVRLTQDMLREIGQLRTTMNELQLEYVKKVEESEIRAEKEVLRKQKEKKVSSSSPQPFGALTWLTNMFQRPSQPKAPLARSVSHDSMSTRYISDRLSTPTIVNDKPDRVIRRKKSDLEKYGPPASFPRSAGEKRRPRSGSVQARPIPYPTLRPSQSTGARRSSPIQAPALEYVVRKKRSALGLRTSAEYDLSTSPASPDMDVDWKVANTFGSSWFNK
ncbi:hypothetical protein EC973_002968 [Apophysomyces ossiformis]|uniref:Uncharacterized protein n=1 Tax=Apophysomyces ossiformis TaxID=679940 RepID=A0A8H7BG22_9FUNG|nr:hypothetical protein EC973_002968 [Apophysomyces ossiformis]